MMFMKHFIKLVFNLFSRFNENESRLLHISNSLVKFYGSICVFYNI